MHDRISTSRRANPIHRERQRGFSFTEILFAVMILGIGFIMIAAIFPVAIHQTEANNQETITASVARASSNYMTQLASTPLPPVSIQYYTLASSSAQTPSILLPTFSNPNSPSASIPTASSYTLPAYQSTMVIPGQVWTLYDTRDPWVYQWQAAPLTGTTTTHPSELWAAMARNLIQADDMRFGWAVMYRRDLIVRGTPGGPGTSIAPATFAQIIMIGVQCRNAQLYNPATDTPNPPPLSTVAAYHSPFLPTLVGSVVNAGGSATGSGVVLVPPTFVGGTSYLNFGGVGGFPAMLTDLTYVVISDDNVPTSKASHGSLNGRIFRVGAAPLSGASAWQLLPGSDMTVADQATLTQMTSDNGSTPPQFNVLIVGRGPSGTGWAGPAQDVAAYTTYVPISN